MITLLNLNLVELNKWRSQLYELGLIGEYSNGIGFGNLSIRLPNSTQLIISGSQTGGIPNLNAKHYSKVTDYSWQENYVTCQGLTKASSETLTHAAIYEADSKIDAVIHVHHLKLWQKLKNQVPTTDPDCAYGTPEMAADILRLCHQESTQQQQIIVMSGHEAGILSFGQNLNQAGKILLHYFSEI